MKKFLVIVDQTPECMKALRFAARRAQNAGAGVMLLFVLEPDEFQHWRMVAETMKAEARDAAEARLSALCDEVQALAGERPEYVIVEGVKRDIVVDFIADTPDVCHLVLGAGVEGEGPGPLVTSLGGQMSGTFRVPLTIVPGGMTFDEIDAVC
ncbi:MAG: universal stress protein [Neomegalonema sp.]|nr:universal stress protein [Neomegalonema sp.]